MLELIATVDPFAAMLGGLWLFAAGLFPAGIMLGSSCSRCCCPQCDSDTITVTLSGSWEPTESVPALSLSFSSDFGSGAAGVVTESGSPGPITAVSLTGGGSGYARIARVTPDITATADGGGSGGTLSVSLTETEHEGRKAWQVASIGVTSGGSGYPSSGDVTFSIGANDTEIYAASAFYRCGRTIPSVSLSVGGTGTGASLTATLTHYAPDDFWYVSSVTVDDGGSGYTAGDPVTLTIDNGEDAGVAFAMTVAVDGSGAVTGVVVDDPYGTTPWWNRGGYFVNTGEIASVTIGGSGLYYGEDPDSAEVATVTVGVVENPACPRPVLGSGAVITATIDDESSSPTYGQIVGLEIENGGDDYLANIVRPNCCGAFFNGKSYVLRRSDHDPCEYRAPISVHEASSVANCGGCGEEAVVVFSGGSASAYAAAAGLGYGRMDGCFFGADPVTAEPFTDPCEMTFTNDNGVAIEVTRGGEYVEAEPHTCGRCCRDSETPPPDEIEVEYSTAPALGYVEGAEVEWGEPVPLVLSRSTFPFDPNVFWNPCDAGYRIRYADHEIQIQMNTCENPCAPEGCDTCSGCEPVLLIGTPFSLFGGNETAIAASSRCQLCSDTAFCSPPPGTYIAWRSQFGDATNLFFVYRVEV